MKSKRERHKELGRQRATIINRALRERPHDFMDVFKEEPVLSISAEMEAIEMEIMQPDFERLEAEVLRLEHFGDTIHRINKVARTIALITEIRKGSLNGEESPR